MIRGCCKKCQRFKNNKCRNNHEPTKGFNSSIYQCGYKKPYAKDKIKDDAKRVQVLIKLLDIVFGDFIRYRDKGVCITCDVVIDPSLRTLIHPGHYISRGKKNTRFDEENVFAQCDGCNLTQNFQGNGLMLEKILNKGKLTMDEVNALRKRSNIIKKFTAHELEELIEEYTIKINKLKES